MEENNPPKNFAGKRKIKANEPPHKPKITDRPQVTDKSRAPKAIQEREVKPENGRYNKG